MTSDISIIGQGGYGVVYKAIDTINNKITAIKKFDTKRNYKFNMRFI